VKDSQLVKYAEYHQLLENKVNEEKEIKERLMSEIKSSYRGGAADGGGDSNAGEEYETEILKQKLDQEVYLKDQLLKELDYLKKSKPQAKPTPATDAAPQFFEALLDKVESTVF
jgi:hypothetical protein